MDQTEQIQAKDQHNKRSKKNRYKGQSKGQGKGQPKGQGHSKDLAKNSLPISSKLCPLCKDQDVEISMQCAGMHSYCFLCIKKWLATKKELSCPECRKVCNNIIKIPNEHDNLSKEFLDFLDSVTIIPNPLKHDNDCKCFQSYFDNTCIYPYWSVIHFIENKDQLELYKDSIENPKYKDNAEDLIKLIKWFIFDEEEKHHHVHNHS